MHPILAGRNAWALEALSERLDLEARSFELGQTESLERALADVEVVLHCAGPFRHTFSPMAQACLRTRTHYLDITGEIGVYRGLWELDADAKQQGLMLLPGAGFDVVPTDCLAAHLKTRLPSATQLALAFRGFGPAGISRGTLNTTIEGAGGPSWVRRDGKLTPVPHLSKRRTVDFGRGPVEVSRMVWGDIFTAYHSTGIPNIEDYYRTPGFLRPLVPLSRLARPLLNWQPLQRLLKAMVRRLLPPGPTDEQRQQSGTAVWGEVLDAGGRSAESRLHGPESYTFTALTCLEIVQRVLQGDAPPGYHTPATAYGPDLVLEIEGVSREDVG